MDGVRQVALVRHLDGDLRPLRHPQRRSGDRAVVGEHPDGLGAEALGDGRDPDRERLAVGQVDRRGRDRVGQAGGVGREAAGGLLAHRHTSVCEAAGRRAGVGVGAGVLVDARGDEPGVVLDEAEQRRAAGVLPRQAEEVEAWDVCDARAVAQPAAPSGTGRSIHEWSGRKPVAQTTASGVATSPSAKLTVRPLAPTTRGLHRHAAAAQPAAARPDQRVAVAQRGARCANRRSCRARPVRVSHQNRSRPSRRCGSGV